MQHTRGQIYTSRKVIIKTENGPGQGHGRFSVQPAWKQPVPLAPQWQKSAPSLASLLAVRVPAEEIQSSCVLDPGQEHRFLCLQLQRVEPLDQSQSNRALKSITKGLSSSVCARCS
jgi:hypothetical protein